MKRPAPARAVILVPTYNEKGNIERVYREIFRAAKNCHLLIVDDNSPDGTGDLADRLAKKDKRVKVLHREGKMGLGSAYVAGMKWALALGYPNVVAMDADLSHDPVNIPKMLDLAKQHDLVIGSRYVKDGGMVNWNARRFLISQLANLFCRVLLGLHQADCSGGFKCYRSALLERIDPGKVFSRGYSFQVEILYRAIRSGANPIEIPIIFVNRHVGESKLNLRELVGFGMTLLKLKAMTYLGKV
jgi:dolichol-phosphate mannosyltransferase